MRLEYRLGWKKNSERDKEQKENDRILNAYKRRATCAYRK